MRPIMSWTGGKSWLWKHVKDYFINDTHDTYIEPFLGGGSMAFNLMKYCHENNINKKFILSDANHELINFYKALQNYPEELMKALDDLWNGPLSFIEIRQEYNRVLGRLPAFVHVERAAMFLYIVKCGFRGMWIINKEGVLTTPRGNGVKKLYNRNQILELSMLLKKFAELRCCDFSEYNESACYYLDPPYVGTFDKYCLHETVTTERLNEFISKLRDSTVYVSNNERYEPPEGAVNVLSLTVDEKAARNRGKTREERLYYCPRKRVSSDDSHPACCCEGSINPGVTTDCGNAPI